MKGKQFTEEQIVRILQGAEAGLSVADVCRKHNCSEQSFYRWKRRRVFSILASIAFQVRRSQDIEKATRLRFLYPPLKE